MPPFKSKSGDADFDRVFNGEEGMRQQLLDELMQISEEESKYKAGQAAIEEQLYSEASIQEIDRQKLLRRGKLITVRRHSRFVEFPLHRHNYVEFMYVVQGEITHVIDGKELTLYKGDLLMLNQYVEHAIHRAEFEDIGINFIALPEFFEIPLGMLQEKNVLAEFIAGAFRQKSPVPHYLIFRLKENPQIENLMENMIESMLYEYMNEDVINQYSMGLVFLYLLNHLENLSHNSSMDYKETIVQSVLEYINSDCKNANLTKIAADTHQSVTVLSKLIKQKTGANFQDLLQQRRFQAAVKLLEETDLSIEDISLDVGYENQSYFFRQFKKRFGMTPRSYRITHQTSTYQIRTVFWSNQRLKSCPYFCYGEANEKGGVFYGYDTCYYF